MRVSAQHFCAALLVAVSFGFYSAKAEAQWVDVTAQVRQHTDLARQIHEACRQHCEGTGRRGTLLSVHAHPEERGQNRVRVTADFLNHHYFDVPLIGRNHVYRYSLRIEAFGAVDRQTCELTIHRINVHNDILGLQRHVRSQEGTKHQVENCRRLLP